MTFPRFAAVAITLLLGLGAAQTPAQTQTYPAQPIKLIVPFPPGGATDMLSRLVGSTVGTETGWNFVIDNRPGASGNIGMDMTAHAKADGYTIAMGQTANLAINPSLYAKMPFDSLKDFVPVALVASQPVVLVVAPNSPYKTLGDLIAAAKARPGKITQALAGTGTVGHLAGEMLARRTAISVVNVPYKGAVPALTDLIGGQTDFMFSTPQSVVAMVKAGKLRALAVTSPARMVTLPDVPTVAESGYAGYKVLDWKALVAPSGTPPAVVKTLNAAVNKALSQPSTIALLLADGSAPMGGTPDQATKMIASEQALWGKVIKESNIKPD